MTSVKADQSLRLLSTWISRRVHIFLSEHLTKRHLALVTDTATLRDAFDSTLFFATSMGRIGADFSALLPPIFESRLVAIVTSYWIDGMNSFEELVKICRDAGIASPLHNATEPSSNTPWSIIMSNNRGDDVFPDPDTPRIVLRPDSSGTDATTDALSPPRSLLSFPPLARLVNAFLTGLNELRRCLLPNTFPTLRFLFRDNFVAKIKDVLNKNERAVFAPGFLGFKGDTARSLRTIAVQLKKEFDSCVEPYLADALEVSFGVIKPEIEPQLLDDRNEDETKVSPSETNTDMAGTEGHHVEAKYGVNYNVGPVE